MTSPKLLRILKELAMKDVIELLAANEAGEAPYTNSILKALANHVHHVATYVQFEHCEEIDRESSVLVADNVKSSEYLQITFRLSPEILREAHLARLQLGDLKWSLIFPNMPAYYQGVDVDLLEQAVAEVGYIDKKVDEERIIKFLVQITQS